MNLDPNVVKGNWTEEEDLRILELYKSIDDNTRRWKMISDELPGRTANSVKNRYHSHIRRNLGSLERHLRERRRGRGGAGGGAGGAGGGAEAPVGAPPETSGEGRGGGGGDAAAGPADDAGTGARQAGGGRRGAAKRRRRAPDAELTSESDEEEAVQAKLRAADAEESSEESGEAGGARQDEEDEDWTPRSASAARPSPARPRRDHATGLEAGRPWPTAGRSSEPPATSAMPDRGAGRRGKPRRELEARASRSPLPADWQPHPPTQQAYPSDRRDQAYPSGTLPFYPHSPGGYLCRAAGRPVGGPLPAPFPSYSVFLGSAHAPPGPPLAFPPYSGKAAGLGMAALGGGEWPGSPAGLPASVAEGSAAQSPAERDAITILSTRLGGDGGPAEDREAAHRSRSTTPPGCIPPLALPATAVSRTHQRGRRSPDPGPAAWLPPPSPLLSCASPDAFAQGAALRLGVKREDEAAAVPPAVWPERPISSLLPSAAVLLRPSRPALRPPDSREGDGEGAASGGAPAAPSSGVPAPEGRVQRDASRMRVVNLLS
eukprot:tig00021293_g20001.t1